jgi:hypothetical protein
MEIRVAPLDSYGISISRIIIFFFLRAPRFGFISLQPLLAPCYVCSQMLFLSLSLLTLSQASAAANKAHISSTGKEGKLNKSSKSKSRAQKHAFNNTSVS